LGLRCLGLLVRRLEGWNLREGGFWVGDGGWFGMWDCSCMCPGGGAWDGLSLPHILLVDFCANGGRDDVLLLIFLFRDVPWEDVVVLLCCILKQGLEDVLSGRWVTHWVDAGGWSVDCPCCWIDWGTWWYAAGL
jgi:hypothetical protein